MGVSVSCSYCVRDSAPGNGLLWGLLVGCDRSAGANSLDPNDADDVYEWGTYLLAGDAMRRRQHRCFNNSRNLSNGPSDFRDALKGMPMRA